MQVIKPDPQKGGVLQFCTELVASADGSIAGLLGASPGASTAAPIMIDVLETCFPDKMGEWRSTLKKIVPIYGIALSENPEKAQKSLAATAAKLGLSV